MSTDAKPIEGLDELKKNLLIAEREGQTFMAVDRFTLRALYEAVKDLGEFAEPLAIGDEVEVVAEHVETQGRPLIGDRGTLVNIEPHAENYPYSVEFRLFAGMGSQIKYFARTELKKVDH